MKTETLLALIAIAAFITLATENYPAISSKTLFVTSGLVLYLILS